MKKDIEKKDLWLLGANVAVWAVVLLVLPLATFLSTRDVTTIGPSFFVALRQFMSIGGLSSATSCSSSH